MSRFVYMHRIGGGGDQHVQVQFSIVIGAVVIVVIGLWDDIKSIRPNWKIGGQVLAAALMLSQGVGLRCAEPMLSVIGERVQLYLHGSSSSAAFFPDSVVWICSWALVIALVV